MKEPDRSRGGTFVRDREGRLLEHVPPTRPSEDAPQLVWIPAAPRDFAPKAATPTTKTTPRSTRRGKE